MTLASKLINLSFKIRLQQFQRIEAILKYHTKEMVYRTKPSEALALAIVRNNLCAVGDQRAWEIVSNKMVIRLIAWDRNLIFAQVMRIAMIFFAQNLVNSKLIYRAVDNAFKECPFIKIEFLKTFKCWLGVWNEGVSTTIIRRTTTTVSRISRW